MRPRSRFSTSRRLCWALLLVLLTLHRTAHAETDLDRARDAYRRGEFKITLLRLQEAESSANLTEDDLVRIHWYRGACFHAQGRKADAASSFDKLLTLRPLYVPDRLEAPPDIRAAFQARADAYQRDHGVTLGDPMLAGPALVIPVGGELSSVTTVAVFVRPSGSPSFSEVALPVEGAEARGPISDVDFWRQVARSGGIELVLEARNVRGVPISRRGDALHPIALGIAPATAEALVVALTPPDPPPATAQATIVVEEAPSSPLRTPFIAGGAALLGGAVLAVVLSLMLGVAAGSSWGGFLWTTERIRTHDKERDWLVPLFYATWGVGVALPVVALAVFALGGLGAVVGAVLLAVGALFL